MEDPGYPFDPRTGPYRNGLLSGGQTPGGLLGAVMSQPGIMQQMANPPTLAQIRDGSADISAPMGLMMGMVSPTPGGGIRAFHGSPFRFDRFDSARINSGEGAQAYGHGLYFAEAPATAETYRRVVPGGGRGWEVNSNPAFDSIPSDVLALIPEQITARINASYGANGPDVARNMAVRFFEQSRGTPYSDALHRLAYGGNWVPRGSMYEVRLNVDPQRMLDWDAPIAGQAPQIGSVFERMTQGGRDPTRTLGRTMYEMAGNRPLGSADPALAASTLREAGIPGIQYLDQGSRAAGQGTRNYVLFPGQDDLIQIIRRYGILGPTAGAGLLGGMEAQQ